MIISKLLPTCRMLFCLLVMLVSGPLHAADEPVVKWDALAPSVAPFDDPFLEMSIDQKSDLRTVLLANEASQTGQPDRHLEVAAVAARNRLDAAGLDADDLLAQRLIVMERRKEEATGVTSTFLDRDVLLDGYVLPLAWENGRATEFLLVPWVGACIHTPPPPPNQIVHVVYPSGLDIERRFEPVRLSGTLRHAPADHALFLIDGNRQIRASYALGGAEMAGTPEKIAAASASEVPPLVRAQIWINGLFTTGMSALENGGSAQALVLAMLLAFGYGALHTLGPGHGKAVVISYFVGTGGSLRRGIVMGVRIAIVHVISAIIVVFLLDLAFREATGAAPSDYRAIRLVSYALIVSIGAAMLWQALATIRARGSGRSPEGAAAGVHNHAHGTPGCAACAAQAAEMKSGWVAAAVGIVPCTGALLVMLFGLANDLVVPAIFMVLAISAGMAFAMSALGIAALWGRDWAERKFAADVDRRQRFENGARLIGATSVLVVGCTLFALTWFHGPAMSAAGAEVAMQGVVVPPEWN